MNTFEQSLKPQKVPLDKKIKLKKLRNQYVDLSLRSKPSVNINTDGFHFSGTEFTTKNVFNPIYFFNNTTFSLFKAEFILILLSMLFDVHTRLPFKFT